MTETIDYQAIEAYALAEVAKHALELEAAALANTEKVITAFRNKMVSDYYLKPTTGYGYSDVGRDTLDLIYAEIFKTEAALVRSQFVSGTHALAVALLGNFLLPISYTVTPEGNYSSGPYMLVPYGAVAFYLLLCAGLLTVNWRQIDQKKKLAIGAALLIEVTVCAMQWLNHTWLISGMGITLMTMSFYLTLENPDILRAELTEQKMSMLYLKSQVNPHFLYNTLDTIRIQAQLNGDKKVADLLMRLVDFFRLSVKVDRQMVALDDEMELLEAYMELMCYRYPELTCEYDIDPELGGVQVPNFILQPIVENSLLHGLKNKGYRGEVRISARRAAEDRMEILVRDTGSGFAEGKKAEIDRMLQNYAKQAARLEGSSIGILNVQKRIKLLCGREYGLSYTENPTGGVTARLLLPLREEEMA